MTTNMVKKFDNAFHSRIHLSLKYPDLSPDSMGKIWVAFIDKAVEGQYLEGDLSDITVTVSDGKRAVISEEQLRILCQANINGRQIKNIVGTATLLATSENQLLSYAHLRTILDTVEQFQMDM